MTFWFGMNEQVVLKPSTIIEGIIITPTEIGRGSYGTVYAALYNGKECVAKELYPYSLSSVELILKEINILRSLSHPSIV